MKVLLIEFYPPAERWDSENHTTTWNRSETQKISERFCFTKETMNMNEEIFISTRIGSHNQALLQNLLQVGCIINRIDHCVEQSLYVNCVPLHNIAVVQKQ